MKAAGDNYVTPLRPWLAALGPQLPAAYLERKFKELRWGLNPQPSKLNVSPFLSNPTQSLIF